MKGVGVLSAVLWGALAAQAQQLPLSTYVRESGPDIAIKNVMLIDGNADAKLNNQTILIHGDRIAAVGPASDITVPANAHVVDGVGRTLLPGLVGMHEHLFTPAAFPSSLYVTLPVSFPTLYLASGVTTARTTGSMDPYLDLNAKDFIDSGRLPGPKLDLTGPYLEGKPFLLPQMHSLANANEARQFVNYWHTVGFTSMKAYLGLTPDELRAAIDQTHRLGMKITGHLCSVSFTEAAEMGIDNLEHGPFGAPDSELSSKRNGNVCRRQELQAIDKDLSENVDPVGPAAQKVIAALLTHHVALTSTLAVFEPSSRQGYLQEYSEQMRMLMTPASYAGVMESAATQLARAEQRTILLQKEMKFERAFVQAGGVLLAGCDPTGDGHTLAGLGDQREFELLVEAGFTVPEAVHIYTLNGATFLGKDHEIGSIVVGKKADLLLLRGDLSKQPEVIRRPELVFKDGVGFDSQKLYDSAGGSVGKR